MARGDVIVHMDDDDYYPPARISSAVAALDKSGLQIAGASRMFVMRAGDTQVASVGPYGPNHATGNTFAYTRAYIEQHRYLDEACYAEEVFFTSCYVSPMVQLPARSTIVAIAHTRNTVDKGHVVFSPVHERFKDLIKEPLAREFYRVKLPAFLAAHPRSLILR
jgi:glycosyltransferase involved in cell wall biosynthesis